LSALSSAFWDAAPKSLDVARNSVNLLDKKRIKALSPKALGSLFLMC
jgi:hypothetical protein